MLVLAPGLDKVGRQRRRGGPRKRCCLTLDRRLTRELGPTAGLTPGWRWSDAWHLASC